MNAFSSFYERKILFGLLYRLGGVAAKFFLVIYISKELSLTDLGLYNIFSATVAWSVFLLGFEFHYYTTREIVGEQKWKVGQFIFNQFVFHLSGLFILAIIAAVLVSFQFIPGSLLLYFIFISLFDQLSQEGARILIAINNFQVSNLIYFVKNGVWVYFLFALSLLGIIHIDIQSILTFWLLSTAGAFAIVIFNFQKRGFLLKKNFLIDKKWILNGLAVSLPFLLTTISVLTIDYSNRYFIDFFLGKEMVGVYGFFQGIASIPVTLITSIFIAQNSPQLIYVYKFDPDNTKKKKSILKKFAIQNLVVSTLFIAGSFICIPWLLDFVGKEQLANNVEVFFLMFVYILIFSIESVVHTTLYSKQYDKFLLFSSIGGGVLNLVLNYYLIPRFGLHGAVYATIASTLVMFLMRASPFLLKRLTK